MSYSLAIENPFGISVFGSALLRVSPDLATIKAAITHLEEKPSEAFAGARKTAEEEKPSEAFAGARKTAETVKKFLRHAKVKESGFSRISIDQCIGIKIMRTYRLDIGPTLASQ